MFTRGRSHCSLRCEMLAAEGFETRVWAGRHPDDPDRIKGLPLPANLVSRLTGRSRLAC